MLRAIAHLPNGEKLATFIRPPGKSRVLDSQPINGAAGIIFTTPDHKVLLLKRARGAAHGGTWGLPAGGLEPGETPRFGARREAREELGNKAPSGDLALLGYFPMSSGERFVAFWQEVDEEFKPKLNHEHTEYQWADLADLPDPLHPGMEDMLATGRLGYEALAHRIALALGKGSTKDDAPMGHPFYGNQYTDVPLGPKPTEAKSPTVKGKVLELLTSGHPWGIDELMGISGAKLKQQVHNALNELKKGKGLQIEKQADGTYKVVKPNGQPAEPPPPPVNPDLAEQLALGGAAPEVKEPPQEAPKTEPGATIAPEPEIPPTPAAPAAPEPQFAPHTAGYVASPPPGGSVSKEEADKHYADHMANLFVTLEHEAKAGQEIGPFSDLGWNNLAKKFKQGKANGMAKWSAMFHGKETKAKPVDVFPEDVKFVKALANLGDKDAAGMKAAFDQWKKDTHAAKHPPPKAEPPAPPPAAAPSKPVELPKVEPPPQELAATGKEASDSVFKVPEHIVDPEHKHISVNDFESMPGLGGSPFVTGMSKLKKLMEGISSNAVGNKVAIQQKLTKILDGSSEFQAVRDAVKAKNKGGYQASAEAYLISSWASSSGDHRPLSVAAQLAIRDVFKMPAHTVETKAFHYLQSCSEEQTYHNAAAELGFKTDTPQKLEQFKKAIRDFALAQYHATQEFFKEQGLNEIYLVRGMKISSSEVEHVKLKLQPASSFTTNYGTAHSFAGSGGTVFVVRVPVTQVIGSYLTGYGCTNEHEVVILNHESLEAVTVPAHLATSATAANSTIKNSSHKIGKKEGWKAPDVTGVQSHGTGPAAPTIGAPAQATAGMDPPKLNAKAAAAWKEIAKTLPDKPPGAKNSNAILAHKAALKKNVPLFNHYLELFQNQKKNSGQQFPASSKWMNELHASFLSAVEKHDAMTAVQPPAMGGTAHAAGKDPGVSHVFGAPVKKNAHFYKKLKEAITNHPAYNEHGYKALKESGVSNEQVYKTLQALGAAGGALNKAQLTPSEMASAHLKVFNELKTKGLI